MESAMTTEYNETVAKWKAQGVVANAEQLVMVIQSLVLEDWNPVVKVNRIRDAIAAFDKPKARELNRDDLNQLAYLNQRHRDGKRRHKLDAIKLVYDITGCGLKASKEWVEANYDWHFPTDTKYEDRDKTTT